MKTLSTGILLGLVTLLVLSLLSGCGPSAEQIAFQTATAQTAEAALWTDTPTATTVPTQTPTPTVTPSPTATRIPTSTPTQTATPKPSATSGPLTTITHKGVTFSFAVPDGMTRSADASKVIFYGPTLDGMQLILSFSLDQYSLLGTTPIEADGDFGIPMFAGHVQNKIATMAQNIQPISEDFLQTPGGEPYFRWLMEHNTTGQQLHQAFYIFGSGNWFVTVMYGRPASAGAEWDERIDAAMQTLQFEE